jgi:DHA2 family multidrug resistance protein-like MFS transporter
MSRLETAAAAAIGDGLPAGRRGLAMAAVLAAVAMASMDVAIANTALPVMAADLHTSAAGSVWIVAAYQMAMTAALLPCASLGDVAGHRRVYLVGLALFTLASLGCALSPNLLALAVARAAQGLGAAAIMSVNTALVRFIYPAKLLGRGVGAVAFVVGVGFTVGPTVASGVLAIASWPWLFAANLPFGLAALVLGWRNLPVTVRGTHSFDPLAAILAALCFGLLIFAMGEGSHDAPHWRTGGEAVVAVICGFLLARRQAGHPAPMLPLDLFQRPVFALSSVTAVCSFTTQGIAFVSLPFLFETVLARSPVETGFLITPWPAVVAVMAPIAARLAERWPTGLLGGIGLALLSVGMLLLAGLVGAGSQSVTDIVWRMALCGLGFGLFQSPNLKALMTSAPPDRAGGASGTIAASRLLGQSSGAALAALCFTLAGSHGAIWALFVGAVFAAAAALASLLRLAA